jgi:ribulose-phosphate 3-epimerase
MAEIIPGILEKDWNEIKKKLELAKSFAKTIHIDIIDGKFAPFATFLDPAPFSKYSQTLFMELHMMVENPVQYLDSFAKAGFRRFIGQIEKMPDQAEFVARAKLLGEVGLAIDGPTDLSGVKVPYDDLDCLLIMTIKAGQSGQVFNQEYLRKIQDLRQADAITGIARNQSLPLEIDGGINDQTLQYGKYAGADRFISTSFIFNSEDPNLQFDLLRSLAEK